MMKKINKKALGPQGIICEAAQNVSNMEELRDFWERFSNTNLLMVTRASNKPEVVKHLTDIIYDSMEGEDVDVGAICRTYSLHWDRPVEALNQLVNYRILFSDDEETARKLNAIQAFVKKHVCKDVAPGRYSKNGDYSTYIIVDKPDIERAIKELTARKQPASARMIKEFLYATLPFVSAAK